MPKPYGPEPLLPPGAAAAGLGAGAGVHAVDDHPAELVDDQVHRGAAYPTAGRAAASRRVERDAQGAGEVVAGAERDQPERALGELVAPVQGRDHGVQAAVAAGHHDRTAPGAVQDAVELAGVGGGGDLDVGALAQHGRAISSPSLSAPPASELVISSSGFHGLTRSGRTAPVRCGARPSGRGPT